MPSMGRGVHPIKRSEAIAASKPRLPRRFAPRSDDAMFTVTHLVWTSRQGVTQQRNLGLKTHHDEALGNRGCDAEFKYG